MTEVIVVDLNSLGVPIWMTSTNDANPDATSIRIVERVRALASGNGPLVVALDCPPYFRKDIDASYKSNRPPSQEPMRFQINKAADILRGDGFPVFGVKGMEADDIAATIAARIVAETKDYSVLVVSADKDLCAIVNDRVRVKHVKDGSIIDEAAVQTHFGVPPSKMVEFLALWGDASDGIKGADKVGPKGAAALLSEFGTLDAMFAAFDSGATPTLTPNLRTRLQEFRPRMATVKSLIELRRDVPLPAFEDIFKPRVAANDVAVFGDDTEAADGAWPAGSHVSVGQPSVPNGADSGAFFPDALSDMRAAMQDKPSPAGNRKPSVADGLAGAAETVGRGIDSFQQREVRPNATPSQAPPVSQPMPAPTAPAEGREVLPRLPEVAQGRELAVRSPEVVVDYERQLEPRSIEGAFKLAQSMFQARLFSAYGNVHAVLATILAGREFGMPAVASLRAFHIVEGKPTLAADTIRAIVLRSGAAEYFRCTARTAKLATFVTKRRGEPEMSLTFTIEEGRAAWPKDDSAWNKSGWGKNPADMLVARAGAKLARLVYPDVVHGIYAKEEMES